MTSSGPDTHTHDGLAHEISSFPFYGTTQVYKLPLSLFVIMMSLGAVKFSWIIFVTWSSLTLSNDFTLVFAFASPTSASKPPRTVLVTGGAGYIGSHTCLELLNLPHYKVVVVDSLDNSSEESLRRVRALTNCDPERLCFRKCDIRDKQGLSKGAIKIEETHELTTYAYWRDDVLDSRLLRRLFTFIHTFS